MYSGVLSNYATLESVLTDIGKAMDGIVNGKQSTGRCYSPKTLVVFNQVLGVAGPPFVGFFFFGAGEFCKQVKLCDIVCVHMHIVLMSHIGLIMFICGVLSNIQYV